MPPARSRRSSPSRPCARGLVPPTAGTRTVDPAIDLDVVVDAPREVSLDAVMSNSFGFGGQNASLLFTR